eukprot:Blabericola_migrator_1__12576@NODE_7_length_25668_cov_124_338502_g6_i0_p5_GENE_NODE_7_length_25668_cov_124_338502_g6_i0NODE_7_length_25668_cov_124_338502_g6_i0_p5_ORF_typecomplete_len742_score53_94_NODE_7_length_25668_cov_124_338502_g6_i025564781
MTSRSEAASWMPFTIAELQSILKAETSIDTNVFKSKKEYLEACRTHLDRDTARKWTKKFKANKNQDQQNVEADRKDPSPARRMVTRSKHSSSLTSSTSTGAHSAGVSRIPKAARPSLEASRLARQQLSTQSRPSAAPILLSTSSASVAESEEEGSERPGSMVLSRMPVSPHTRSRDFDRVEEQLHKSLQMLSSGGQGSGCDSDKENMMTLNGAATRHLSRTSMTMTFGPSTSLARARPRTEDVSTPFLRQGSGERPSLFRHRVERSAGHQTPSNQKQDARTALPYISPALRNAGSSTPSGDEASAVTPLLQIKTLSKPGVRPPPSFAALVKSEGTDNRSNSPSELLIRQVLKPSTPKHEVASRVSPAPVLPPVPWWVRRCRLLAAIVALFISSLTYYMTPEGKLSGSFHVRVCADLSNTRCTPVCPRQAICDVSGVVSCEPLRKLVKQNASNEWQCVVDDAVMDRLLTRIVDKLRADYVSNCCSPANPNFGHGRDMYELLNEVDKQVDPLAFSSILAERYEEYKYRYKLERFGFELSLLPPLPRCSNFRWNSFYGFISAFSPLSMGDSSAQAEADLPGTVKHTPRKTPLIRAAAIIFTILLSVLVTRQKILLRRIKKQCASFIYTKTHLVVPEMYLLGPTLQEVSNHLLESKEFAPQYCSVPSVLHLMRYEYDVVLCGLRHCNQDFFFSLSRAKKLLAEFDESKPASATPPQINPPALSSTTSTTSSFVTPKLRTPHPRQV